MASFITSCHNLQVRGIIIVTVIYHSRESSRITWCPLASSYEVFNMMSDVHVSIFWSSLQEANHEKNMLLCYFLLVNEKGNKKEPKFSN